MRIVEYNKTSDIVVEFQDEYRYRTNNTYRNFKTGCIKNPYHPSLYGVGVIGTKYPVSYNCKNTKEYDMWHSMLQRCYDKEYKEKRPAYKYVTCCEEWLLFENYYEWLHSQDNFDKWYNGKRWAVDKDILFKGNKIYSPKTCCLVPQNVNCLFLKRDAVRGEYPIGVRCESGIFKALCKNSVSGKTEELGSYPTVEEAFNVYKEYKENIIKQVAQKEYEVGNITKRCYESMMNYKVEITD